MEESCEFLVGIKGRMVSEENFGFGVRKLESFDNSNDNNENNSNYNLGKGVFVYYELGV